MTTWLTTRDAAARTGRSVRTIRRWHRDGLPARHTHRGNQFEEETLLAWLRAKTLRNPVHRHRMAAAGLHRDTP